MQGCASFGCLSNCSVYELDCGIVFFDDVRGVGRAGACDVGAGVGCAAKAAGWCGLVSISECEFPVI